MKRELEEQWQEEEVRANSADGRTDGDGGGAGAGDVALAAAPAIPNRTTRVSLSSAPDPHSNPHSNGERVSRLSLSRRTRVAGDADEKLRSASIAPPLDASSHGTGRSDTALCLTSSTNESATSVSVKGSGKPSRALKRARELSGSQALSAQLSTSPPKRPRDVAALDDFFTNGRSWR